MKSRAERIAELSARASDWRAALMILTSEYLTDDGRVWAHVDLEHESIHFDRMLEDGTFSGGERRLIEIAASLFSTTREINLWKAFGYLDETAAELALSAIAAYCRIEGQKVNSLPFEKLRTADSDLLRATHAAWHLTHTLTIAPEVVTPAMIEALHNACHAALLKAKGEFRATHVFQGPTAGKLMGVTGIQILCSCNLEGLAAKGPQVSNEFRVTINDGRPVIDVVCPECRQLGRAEFFT